MPRVIAYTYNSDVHCLDCTRQDTATGRLIINNSHPHARSGRRGCYNSDAIGYDENGIACNLQDSEGNLIHPVFDTDEHGFTHCGSCRAEL